MRGSVIASSVALMAASLVGQRNLVAIRNTPSLHRSSWNDQLRWYRGGYNFKKPLGDHREDGKAPTRRRRQAAKAGPNNTILGKSVHT